MPANHNDLGKDFFLEPGNGRKTSSHRRLVHDADIEFDRNAPVYFHIPSAEEV